MTRQVHVVGAGLAGLAAALKLQRAGLRVTVHEAAAHAGGRCRSYFDRALQTTIDNGNHLVLSGNRATLDYLDALGARAGLRGPAEAVFPFFDLGTGARWDVSLGRGRLPAWIFDARRRVPGTRARDYLALAPLLWARPGRTIGDVLRCEGVLWSRLLHPLLLAVLNTDPREGAAVLAGCVMRETLVRGGAACRPLVAHGGLGAAFVEPALRALQQGGAEVRLRRRLRALSFDDGGPGGPRVAALDFDDERIVPDPHDALVLAVPPGAAADLLPGLAVPDAHRAIVNLHFGIAPPPGFPPVMGLLNGTAEWLFAFDGRLSVTISGADRLLDVPRESLIETVWAEVAAATGLPATPPPAQVIRERRATFAATPAQEHRRPAARTRWCNLALAGDWTATGLPATIEGAIRSGNTAADVLLNASTNPSFPPMNHCVDTNMLKFPAGTAEAAEARALDALLARQRDDGHWVFELEADATIPAEYVLMRHYLGEAVDAPLEAKLGRYLRRIQNPDGGWPLFTEGASDVSASVKAYFALKMIGDDIGATHMRRAREAILARGGAAASNVFTRILLALFGILPWRAVPAMPVEVVLLPAWFPFHLSKISYWARTVIVPLLVLAALKPRARNPLGVGLDELFLTPPEAARMAPRAPHQKVLWFAFFRVLDSILRVTQGLTPGWVRRRAIARAVAFVSERLNGEDGLGAIFPAMVNAVEMFDALGVPRERPDMLAARRAIDKLLVIGAHEAYCQPCVSPVWDTALAAQALLEAGSPRAVAAAERGLQWLRPLQILDTRGDWISRRPCVRPGGWAFQYANPHYPDVDDTAVVAMAMDRAVRLPEALLPLPAQRYDEALARAVEWVLGMQSSDGGWGAFEPENTQHYLNNIPFSDHGALLDPPTADVSARCLSMLAQLRIRAPQHEAAAQRARAYLLREQCADGSWYGRWGMNYIYGTWAALCALHADGQGANAAATARAVGWLAGIQNEDGGWGEGGESYRLDYHGYEAAPSTASQTAWALLGLMAAGAGRHPAVARGVAWLVERQNAEGLWDEARFTATGFPRVFYLRYHGYAKYFPLWALARYRRLQEGDMSAWGM